MDDHIQVLAIVTDLGISENNHPEVCWLKLPLDFSEKSLKDRCDDILESCNRYIWDNIYSDDDRDGGDFKEWSEGWDYKVVEMSEFATRLDEHVVTFMATPYRGEDIIITAYYGE